MMRQVILGLLRDGGPHHGYELMIEHKRRSGEQINTGNFYRELSRLAADDLVQTGVNPPDADPRRIPYQITDKGCRVFDQWLVSSQGATDELPDRLLFLDRIPLDVRARLFDRWQEELWLRGKTLARAREDALAVRACADSNSVYYLLPALLLRRIAHITAELEFLKEFRLESDSVANRGISTDRAPAATAGSRAGSRQDKRSSRS